MLPIYGFKIAGCCLGVEYIHFLYISTFDIENRYKAIKITVYSF